MSNLIHRSGFLSSVWRPVTVSVRHHRRVNIQRPRAPHYERARVLELIKPIYKKPIESQLPPALKCLKKKEIEDIKYRPNNPYERMIAKEVFNWLDKSKLVAFLHINPISGEDQFEANIKFRREKMFLNTYSHHTMKMAVENTKYEPILQLFQAHSAVVFCEEPEVGKLIKVVKKIPQYILMASIVEGRLLSMSQMVAYSQLKDLTSARSQLTAVMSSAASLAVSQLSRHQSTLLTQLRQRADDLQSQSKDTNK